MEKDVILDKTRKYRYVLKRQWRTDDDNFVNFALLNQSKTDEKNIAHTNKVILMYGRFSEKIDGIPIIEIPLCDPSNEGNWMGWTKKELEKKNYEVHAPQITKVWEAPYSEWKKVIDEIGVDENTTLVGLSAGGAAVTRYISEGKISRDGC